MGIPVNNSQDTGNKGVDILSLKCDSLGFSFREMPIKDVGIDGEIELRLGGKYNEKFQVQVKSSSKFQKKKDGTIKIIPLDRDHLEYWNTDINLPVFLVGVETSTKKVYWCNTREYYEKIRKNEKQKTIQAYSNSKNELNDENKTSFINFLRELDKYNAEQVLSKNSPLEKIRIIGGKKGLEITENKAKNSLSIIANEYSKNVKISGNMSIEKQLSNNKFEINNFSLNLDSENIINGIKGTMELLPVKENLQISIATVSHIYIINVEKYIEGDYMFMQSKKGETIQFTSKINITSSDLSDSTSSFHIDFEKEETLKDIFDYLNFMQEANSSFTLSLINKNGKSEKFLGGNMNEYSGININFLSNFIQLLISIENKYKVTFSPTAIFNGVVKLQDMIDLEPYMEAMVKGEYISKGKAVLKITLTDKNDPIYNKKKTAFRQTFKGICLFTVDIPIEISYEGEGKVKKDGDKVIISMKSVRYFI